MWPFTKKQPPPNQPQPQSTAAQGPVAKPVEVLAGLVSVLDASKACGDNPPGPCVVLNLPMLMRKMADEMEKSLRASEQHVHLHLGKDFPKTWRDTTPENAAANVSHMAYVLLTEGSNHYADRMFQLTAAAVHATCDGLVAIHTRKH